MSRAGKVIPGELAVTINEDTGTVSSLTITNPGKYYTRDFLISFTGGGGSGAFAYGYVDPIELGGGIKSVELISDGENFTSVPTPILGDELTQTQFEIFTSQPYGADNENLKYSAHGEAIEAKVAYIDLKSGGVGYSEIPPANGLIKRQGDRAKFKVNLDITTDFVTGTGIDNVEVVSGGARYVNPQAILVTDRDWETISRRYL